MKNLFKALIASLAFAANLNAATYYVSYSSGSAGGPGTASSPYNTFSAAWTAQGGGHTYRMFPGTATFIYNPPSGTNAAAPTVIMCDVPNGCWVNGQGANIPIEIDGTAQKHDVHFRYFFVYNGADTASVRLGYSNAVTVQNQHYNLWLDNIFSSGTSKTGNSGNIELNYVRNSSVTNSVATGFGGRYGLQLYEATDIFVATNVFTRFYNGTDANPCFAAANYNTWKSTWANNIFMSGEALGVNCQDHGGLYVVGNNNAAQDPYVNSEQISFYNNIFIDFSVDSNEIALAMEATSTNNNRIRVNNNVFHRNGYGVSLPRGNSNVAFTNNTISSSSVDGIYAGNTSGSAVSWDSMRVSSNAGIGFGSAANPTNSNVVGNGTNFSGSAAGAGTVTQVTSFPYVVRIETGSADKGSGSGGKDRGANVIRFWDPTATTTALMWPWPNEKYIASGIRSIFPNSKFGRRKDSLGNAVTISTYILTALNYAYPPEYQGQTAAGPSCTGALLDPVITNVTTGSLTISWTSSGPNYILVFDDHNDFTSPVSSATVSGTNTTSFGNLNPSTLYYAKVKDSTAEDCSYTQVQAQTNNLPPPPLVFPHIRGTGKIKGNGGIRKGR